MPLLPLTNSPFTNSVTGLTWAAATRTLSLTSGYVIPTTTKESNWNGAVSGLSTHIGLTGTSVHGLGGASILNVGTAAGTVAAGDHSHSGVYQPVGEYLTGVTADSPLSGAGTSGSHLTLSAVDATHAGYVPLSGTPASRNFLRAAATSGAVAWDTITAADVGLGTGTSPAFVGLTLSGQIINQIAYYGTGGVLTGTAAFTLTAGTLQIVDRILQVTTTAGGTGATDGFQIQMDASYAYLWHYENAGFIFGTNNATRMTIAAAGEIGIATAPSAGTALSVAGSISLTTGGSSANYGITLPTRGQRITIGTYGTVSETVSGAAYITGNNLAASRTTANKITKTASTDAGQYFGMRYDRGIWFGTGIGDTDAIGTEYADTANERMRLDLLGNLGLGTAIFGTSAAGVFAIANGTQGAALANVIQLVSEDLSAGNTTLSIRAEGTGITGAAITNVTVTHKIALKINGTVYYFLATTSAA